MSYFAPSKSVDHTADSQSPLQEDSTSSFSCTFASLETDSPPDSRPRTRGLAVPLPPSVVRSFLDDGTRSLTELRDVSSLFEVAERAAVIVKECRIPVLSAFYFCVDFPTGTPETFRELKHLTKRVFRLEGHRIMHMLEEKHRERLLGTPLEDVVQDFRNRDSRAMILSELRTLVSHSKAVEILNHQACAFRISIGGEERALARELVNFWNQRDQTEVRREQLELAFSSREMTLRPTCPICNAYISGAIHAELEDVVGLSIIVSRLRGRRKELGIYFAYCEEEFKHHFHVRKCDLSTAIRDAMRVVRLIDKRHILQLKRASESAFLTFL